jgi:hypothetical protein
MPNKAAAWVMAMAESGMARATSRSSIKSVAEGRLGRTLHDLSMMEKY